MHNTVHQDCGASVFREILVAGCLGMHHSLLLTLQPDLRISARGIVVSMSMP